MEIITRPIAEFIVFIGSQAQAFWANLTLLNFSYQQIIVDILLVSFFFYYIFSLLKRSRAFHILVGILIMSLIFLFSKILQLPTLGWLLDRILTIALVAIPVIFQQELRMGLERLGKTKFSLHNETRTLYRMIIHLVDASYTLAKSKKGALIVLQHAVPLKEYADTGIPLQAVISKELLLSIFNLQSPLHDGAVIIEKQRIVAAGCILPHSFKQSGTGLGTRHKAALGLSENTDASIIVVSEERGTVSFAHEGTLEKDISASRLQGLLSEVLKLPRKKVRSRRASGEVH